MPFSRYTKSYLRYDAKGLQTSTAVSAVRSGITTGEVNIVDRLVTTQADRLDTLSGEIYGDARYWWVLAAASNIGWGMQVPPGTIIFVPDLKSVEKLIG